MCVVLSLDLTEPRIEFDTDPRNLFQGGNYIFSCSALGQPSNFSLQWYRGGKVIKRAGKQLELKNVSKIDAGKYECFVKSELVEKNVSLTIQVAGDVILIFLISKEYK